MRISDWSSAVCSSDLALSESNAGAAPAVHYQRRRLGVGLDQHAATAARPLEIGPCGRAAVLADAGHLRVPDAFGLGAVQVGAVAEARLLGGLHEAVGHRQDGAVVLDLQRPPGPAIRLVESGRATV